MGDNNEHNDNIEQEAGFDVINAINDDDDGGDLFERIYRGDRLVNIPSVPFRLIIHVSITKIDTFACYGCLLLMEVIFHNKVTEIGRHAFARCRNLQPVELPARLLRLEHLAFQYCTSLPQIMIPASVQYMGVEVFAECTSLESVVFEPRTTNFVELGSGIFWSCSILRFVTLPQNLQSIPMGFFSYCTLLAAIRIPPSVQRIERDAFSGSAIQSIDCPEKVHRIDRDAFKNCAFLERVTIHSTNLNLAHNIFVNCPLLSVVMIAPWLWSKLLASMNEHPEFIFRFIRHYSTQIFDGDSGGAGNVVEDLQRSESVDNNRDDTADGGSGDEDVERIVYCE